MSFIRIIKLTSKVIKGYAFLHIVSGIFKMDTLFTERETERTSVHAPPKHLKTLKQYKIQHVMITSRHVWHNSYFWASAVRAGEISHHRSVARIISGVLSGKVNRSWNRLGQLCELADRVEHLISKARMFSTEDCF